MPNRLLLIVLMTLVIASCRPTEEAQSIDAQVMVDGQSATYSFSRAVTVDQLLASAQIDLGPQDRVSHPLVAQIADGMLITIRRVREEEVCERREIAHQRRALPREGVPAGGQRLGQAGSPGIEEACYRIVLEDGREVRRILIGDPIVVQAPIAEIIYTGSTDTVAPVAIAGRLSYINHNNAWTIKDNAVNKQPLTINHNLDSLVFHQSEAGTRLIFSSETDPTDVFFNELWMISTAAGAEPQRLTPSDALFAEWRPRSSNTIAYSTGEPSTGTGGWKALNNLWLMTIDLESGRTLTIEEALPESGGGLYGWWGTHFAWSPLGDQLAWARADGFGLVDFERRRLTSLAEYAVFHSATNWVWLSSLSWSHDSRLLASIIHGPPQGDEPAETSPIFDIAVTSAEGRFTAPVSLAAGMWAAPSYSPKTAVSGTEHSEGYLAWLQAREPQNSMNGDYDLVIADRDGSNQRHLFPPPGEGGIQKRDFGLTPKDFAWSPDARHIAVIYSGDLWLVDVESADAQQLTFDGGSSNPVWTR